MMLGFRVWDIELKKIFTSEAVGCFNMSMFGSLRFWADDGLCEAPARFIPMQSTGIRDSLRAVIFEKDILMFSNDGTDEEFIIVDTAPYFLRAYHGYLVRMLPDVENRYSLTRDLIEKESLPCEIVGNAFENPELLEKIKWKTKKRA
jgi:uncharacterized phage protein (TIGR01671 family)